ncbi:MAG: hypothetical protein PHC75_08410 [Burkholderiales bacterium]|nr:hypothetical protein [Burkholderiales bacterium]
MDKKINVKEIFLAINFGAKSFYQRFFLHFLTTIIVPIMIGTLFLVIYYSALILKQDAFILPLSYPLFCMMLPLMMANLAITDRIHTQNITKINYAKYILNTLWNSEVLKLIFICALLQTAVYLASLYAINSDITFAKIIYNVFSIAAIIFQVIIFFAVPAKISDQDNTAPFTLLYKTLIACLKNFIPILLFVIISIASILLIALVVPKSIYAIYLFLVLIILFMILFGIVCNKIANKIIN